MSKETIEKRTKTMKIFREECISYFNQFKNKEIVFEDIPKKFHKTIKG